MKYLIVIPSVNKTITDKCLRSLAPEVLRRVYLVDNSGKDELDKYFEAVYWINSSPENLGVAGSWNVAAKEMVEGDMDYLVICSSAMVFGKGGRDLVWHLEHTAMEGLETNGNAWHLNAISRGVFEKIGYFDINFYPAYYEDSDLIRRMELAGIMNVIEKNWPYVDIDAKCQETGHGAKSVKVNYGACRDYFIRKWGVEPKYDSHESRDLMYKHPFNDSTKGLGYCEPTTIADRKRAYGL